MRATASGICARVTMMLAVACSCALGADDRPLLERMPSAAQISARDATVTVEAGVIRVPTGHRKPWPGITLDALGGQPIGVIRNLDMGHATGLAVPQKQSKPLGDARQKARLRAMLASRPFPICDQTWRQLWL
jgi:hypothetical protein